MLNHLMRTIECMFYRPRSFVRLAMRKLVHAYVSNVVYDTVIILRINYTNYTMETSRVSFTLYINNNTNVILK